MPLQTVPLILAIADQPRALVSEVEVMGGDSPSRESRTAVSASKHLVSQMAQLVPRQMFSALEFSTTSVTSELIRSTRVC